MGKRQALIHFLVKEIDKVVSAPYMVLLKPLSCLLENADDNDIHLWTKVKNCQISNLVCRILESLEKDEAAQAVLLKLIQNPTVRNEILKQSPEMIQQLFSNASAEDIHETCLAMCKHPFPEDFVPPPEYYIFIEHVLSNKGDNSLDNYLRISNLVLSTMTSTMIFSISENTLRKCISLWNEASRTTDSFTFVQFLSIAATIHRLHLDDQQSFCCDSVCSPKPDPLSIWTAKCSSLFGDEKARKMAKTVLLRTLQLLSENPINATEKTLECLDRVRIVLETIPTHLFHSIACDQDFKQILVKLAQKGASESLPFMMRLGVHAILLVVDKERGHGIPATLNSLFDTFLGDLALAQDNGASAYQTHVLPPLAFQQKYHALLLVLESYWFTQTSLLKDLMQQLVGWCRPGMYATIEMMAHLQSASDFVNDLYRLEASGGLEPDVCRCIVDTVLPEWWNWNLASSHKIESCCSLEVCPLAIEDLQNKLKTRISRLMIGLACTSGFKLSQTTYRILQDEIRGPREVGGQPKCSWPQRINRVPGKRISARISSLQTKSDIGQMLGSMLETTNKQMVDVFWSHADDVCRDLQRRCDNVEAPLMAERAKSRCIQEKSIEIEAAMDVMIADHKARELMWQNALDVERREAAILRDCRAQLETKLFSLTEQLDTSTKKILSMDSITADLHTQCAALREDLEQQQLVIKQRDSQYERLTSEYDSMGFRLRTAEEKEHQLLQVLQGASA